ncbi:hypothetical protein GGX14DRAFT_546590 [Mycena pura]|uniref:F-box domain-containing protein n=1 Tax=Mycena pura TaxID=153505 RepID=A0AAD6UWP3_9AGAR|nr:hypothetical protein GGX14DRAFT_546590 [Mycena pura]
MTNLELRGVIGAVEIAASLQVPLRNGGAYHNPAITGDLNLAAPTMRFSELDEDIIPHILSFCDVQSVLRVAQTNKLLHTLASRISVWRALIQDLSHRRVVDVLPADVLLRSAAADLRDEVKRAVCGPVTWSPASAALPAAHRELSFKFPSPATQQSIRFLKPLLGGECAVFQRDNSLEIWSLAGGRCLWSWPVTAAYVGSIEDDGGQRLLVLLCVAGVGPLSQEKSIQITEVELDTKEARVVFDHWHTPSGFTYRSGSSASTPSVSRDYFAAALDTLQGEELVVLLVNWRLRTYVAFKFESSRSKWTVFNATQATTVSLTFEHIIITCALNDPPHHTLITVYDIKSLACWLPLDDFSRQPGEYVAGIPPLVCERLRADGRALCDPGALGLAVHRSPLCRDAYLLKLYVSFPPGAGAAPAPARATVFTFALARAPGPAPGASASLSAPAWTWRTVAAVPGVPELGAAELSLAGYVFPDRPPEAPPSAAPRGVVDALLSRDGAVRLPESPEVPLDVAGWRIAGVAPTSGALVLLNLKGQTIRFVYYR